MSMDVEQLSELISKLDKEIEHYKKVRKSAGRKVNTLCKSREQLKNQVKKLVAKSHLEHCCRG